MNCFRCGRNTTPQPCPDCRKEQRQAERIELATDRVVEAARMVFASKIIPMTDAVIELGDALESLDELGK